MPSWTKYLVTGIVGMLLVACIGVTFWVVQQNSYSQARQRWEQQQLREYELEMRWVSDWSEGHVVATIRNNRIVDGVDVLNGGPLVPLRIQGANYYASVDNLFALIDALNQPPPNWRSNIARHHPLLARWLDPCVPQVPSVQYDSTFGYPISITYPGSPCNSTTRGVTVVISRFQPEG